MKREFQGGLKLGTFSSAVRALVRAILYKNIYLKRGEFKIESPLQCHVKIHTDYRKAPTLLIRKGFSVVSWTKNCCSQVPLK